MIPRFCQRPDRALGSFVADLDTRSPSATGHRPGGAGGDGRRLTLALLAGRLPIATRCVGYPADQGRQGFQVLLSDLPPDGVGPGVLLRGQRRLLWNKIDFESWKNVGGGLVVGAKFWRPQVRMLSSTG